MPLFDRQLAQLMVAGDWLRLGQPRRVNAALNAVQAAVREEKAWFAPTLKDEERNMVAHQLGILKGEVARRKTAMAREVELLSNAADHMRRALSLNEYDAIAIPAQVYLVDECERRAGNFGRAYTWLEASTHFSLPKDKQGAEIWGGEQTLYLQTCLGQMQFKQVPDNPSLTADAALLHRLAAEFKAAFPPAAATPPAAGAKTPPATDKPAAK